MEQDLAYDKRCDLWSLELIMYMHFTLQLSSISWQCAVHNVAGTLVNLVTLVRNYCCIPFRFEDLNSMKQNVTISNEAKDSSLLQLGQLNA